jgi:hypothetical protein
MNLLPDFNSSSNTIAHKEVNGTFHSVVESYALAETLVRDGSRDSIETAEKVIKAVLDCQKTDQDDPSDVTLTTFQSGHHFQGMTSGLIELRGNEVRVISTPPQIQSMVDAAK